MSKRTFCLDLVVWLVMIALMVYEIHHYHVPLNTILHIAAIAWLGGVCFRGMVDYRKFK